jgi:GTPase SAR1 family protein
MLLVGPSGSGKTTLAEKFAEKLQGRMQILQPIALGERFSHEINWDACDCLVLDDVSHWEYASVADAVSQLEGEAEKLGKKLLLILQDEGELEEIGIWLKSEPAIFQVAGAGASAIFKWNGKSVSFP